MQSFKWLGFCASNALTRTMVHFYPSAGSVTAPYPANFKLTLFGQGIVDKSVTLEGARLSQPDGVRLEEAFPALKEGASGFFGIELEIATMQPRVDLSGSSIVIELSSQGHACRFWPVSWDPKAEARIPQPILGLRDPYNNTSVVLINGTAEPVRPDLLQISDKVGADIEPNSVKTAEVPAQSVVEITLSDAIFQELPPIETSYGLVRATPLSLKPLPPTRMAAFVLYRDTLTKRPVSVTAL